MKKTFNSNSNLLVRLKNFWFAAQLFIVSVSLPVLCIVEIAHTDNETINQKEEVIKNAAGQTQSVSIQNESNTIKWS